MAVRPRLKSYARPVLRTAAGLRLGVYPDLGVVIEGLSCAEGDLLRALDGRHDVDDLYRLATRTGVSAQRVDDLLGALRRRLLLIERPSDRVVLGRLCGPQGHEIPAELLAGAEALSAAYQSAGDGLREVAARTDRVVTLDGAGTFVDGLAQLLARAGIGTVRVVPPESPTDPGGTAADAFPDTSVGWASTEPDRPDLVVVVGRSAISPIRAARWRRGPAAVMPIVLHDHRAVVGPIGAAGVGPCLRCLDLHRRDRDASWPGVLAQLEAASARAFEVEAALAALAGGVAAMMVLTYLDGRPSDGVSLEIGWPWPMLTQRRWAPHPRCGCASTA